MDRGVNTNLVPRRSLLAKAALVSFSIACLLAPVSPGLALLLGTGIGLGLGTPAPQLVRRCITRLLGIAIIGLGAGADWRMVVTAGQLGATVTILGLLLTFVLGLALARMLKTPRDLALLLISGTAICGGSAIAAVAAVLRVRQEHAGAALGAVFCLNALALYLFPWLGMQLAIAPADFGLWAALAIHDTSSVVGAAEAFHTDSVPVAIAVKLARALWIAPLAVVLAIAVGGVRAHNRLLPPWFLFGFLALSAARAWRPDYELLWQNLYGSGRRLLVLAIFLVGCSLTSTVLRNVGLRSFALALILWTAVSTASLAAIRMGWIMLPAEFSAPAASDSRHN